jgi:hypothetical protein
MDLTQVIASISQDMMRHFNTLSVQHRHRGLRGFSREAVLREYLQGLLPMNVDIGHGEVFDADGQYSGECDAIIYDRIRTPIFFSEGQQMMPAESVYGVIEVKSRLDLNEFGDCVKKCQKIKQLNKKAFYTSTESDTIIREVNVYGQKRNCFPIFFLVFAYQSIDPLSLCRTIEQHDMQTPIDGKIEMITCLERGWATVWQHVDGAFDLCPRPESRRIVADTGDNTLLTFYLMLHLWMSQARCPPLNMTTYVNANLGNPLYVGQPMA